MLQQPKHNIQQHLLFCALFAIMWPLALSQDPAIFDSFKSTENKALIGFVFKVINEVTLFQCYRECQEHQRELCSSVNFYPSNGRCELNFASHISHPNKMEDEEGATYLFNLAQREDIARSGLWSGLGSSKDIPVKTCKSLKDLFPALPSGNYWLDVDLTGPKTPFLGYCDMETDGGGWTLVWSFTFSMYNIFRSQGNYVKPYPRNLDNNALEQSSTPPKNETDMNAIDFNIWKDIGSEFLVKSNINNWVACAPNGGSLVTKTAGNLHCRFIKQIVTESPNCKEIPGKMYTGVNGILLIGKTTNGQMYYFVHGTTHWPTHDPCAMTSDKHRKNVDNPHTNIYLR